MDIMITLEALLEDQRVGNEMMLIRNEEVNKRKPKDIRVLIPSNAFNKNIHDTKDTPVIVFIQKENKLKKCELTFYSHSMKNFSIPPYMKKGHVVADGNCFLHSFRVGLERLGRIDSIHRMRAVCKSFAEEEPPEWFVATISSSHSGDYSVKTDSVREYIANIEGRDTWADPDVEGRILCAHYDLSLYVIERLIVNGQPLYIYQVVSGSGSRYVTEVSFEEENAIYIINEGYGHFEPIIDDRGDIPQGPEDISSAKLDAVAITQSREITAVAEKLAIDAFNKFENAIKIGDLKHLRKLIKFLFRTVDRMELARLYRDPRNSIRLTHPVTLACEYGQHDVLSFLLHKTNVLHYLGVEGRQKERARVRALVAAMLADDTRLLEALYEHWAGAAHWLAVGVATGPVLHELIWLKTLLLTARDRCQHILEKDQQMLVDVHCFVTFNEFQIELYSKLSELKAKYGKQGLQGDRKQEVEAVRDALLTAFKVYEYYSNKNIRLTKHLVEDKETLCRLLNENSIYMKYISYLMYELYYRKLDHNMALLIINNLHYLKLRLQMPFTVYQDIEAVLYYFLYRVYEDWDLYLPENRPKGKKYSLGFSESGDLGIYKILHDPYRVSNGLVLYLERSKYKKGITYFKTALENDADNKLRVQGTKLSDEEVNSLSVLPYMRDDYSLKKMLEYMDHLSFVDMTRDKTGSLLIIERVIQVTGEFLKSSKETCHLSPITTVLLKCEIPQDAYQNLTDLRDYLSHVREGKLIRRIDLEENAYTLFENTIDDLYKIKEALEEVVKVYKPMLDKSLLNAGWSLIRVREAELPKEATHWKFNNQMQLLHTILHEYSELYMKVEDDFLKSTWSNLGFNRQLLRECVSLNESSLILRQKMEECDRRSCVYLAQKLPQYSAYILQILDNITQQQLDKVWVNIKENMKNIVSTYNSQNFPHINLNVETYPNEKCIETIGTELKKVKKNTLKSNVLRQLKIVHYCSVEWFQIRKLLQYMIKEIGVFRNHHWEIKKSEFTRAFSRIDQTYPNCGLIVDVRWVLGCMNSFAAHYNQTYVPKQHNYKGLAALKDELRQKHFITKDELEYFRANTDGSCLCDANQRCVHAALYAKLYDGIPIHERDYENAKTLVMNSKCRKIITNLTNGKKRNNSRVECLLRRSEQLARAVGATRSPEVLAVRYRHDGKFRCVAEMLTSDILNIYGESALGPLFNERRTRLLAESPLRNVLEHGSPLLEVGGAVFDDEDYPHALMALALAALEDLPAVRLLAALLDQGVLLDSPALQPAQRDLVARFKACPNWQAYAKLAKNNIPNVKLNNGREMPVLGYGTWLGLDQQLQFNESDSPKLVEALSYAVDVGYRHVDTAHLYRVEPQVGGVLNEKIQQGVVTREQLFVTTKVWQHNHRPSDVQRSARESLRRLNLDYVDLLLLHWPMAISADGADEEIDYVETWRGLEAVLQQGLARSIGVSNFNVDQLTRLLDNCAVPPAVNQVEINVTLGQRPLVEFCQKHRIVVVGYSPLGSMLASRAAPGAPPPRLDHPALAEVARRHGKTVSQVVLKYLRQRGIVIIPKTITKSRVLENATIFDFALDAAEIEAIEAFDVGYRTVSPTFWQEYTHYPFEKVAGAVPDIPLALRKWKNGPNWDMD